MSTPFYKSLKIVAIELGVPAQYRWAISGFKTELAKLNLEDIADSDYWHAFKIDWVSFDTHEGVRKNDAFLRYKGGVDHPHTPWETYLLAVLAYQHEKRSSPPRGQPVPDPGEMP